MTNLVSAGHLSISVYGSGILLNCIVIAVCGILVTAVLNERLTIEQNAGYFTAFVLSIMFSSIVEAMICLLAYSGSSIALIKLLTCAGYIANQVIVFFYSIYMIDSLRHRTFVSTAPLYVVAFVLAFSSIIWVVSLYNWEVFASFDEFGNMVKTDYFAISNIAPAFVLIFDVILAYSCREYISHSELISWISFVVFPIMGMILNSFIPLELMQQGEALAALMMYVYVHGDTARKMALQQQELTESRVKVMLSQIQPHFMYNSLNSIYYLIGKDPEIAQEAVNKFSTYLRSNINSLKSDKPVSFDTELNHVQTYLYLEKLRFDDELEIVYDIKEHGFLLPPLTIQPIVENAVKYGIGSKKGGGVITISSYKKGNYYEVTVEDNGTGFDTSVIAEESTKAVHDFAIDPENEQSTHIGMVNVRERLKTLMHGQLIVDSRIGKGTKVTIRVPADEIKVSAEEI